jgi:hypothetical protein
MRILSMRLGTSVQPHYPDKPLDITRALKDNYTEQACYLVPRGDLEPVVPA